MAFKELTLLKAGAGTAQLVNNGEGNSPFATEAQVFDTYKVLCAPAGFDPTAQPINIIEEFKNYSNINKRYIYSTYDDFEAGGWWIPSATVGFRLERGDSYRIIYGDANNRQFIDVNHAQTAFPGTTVYFSGNTTELPVISTDGFPASGIVFLNRQYFVYTSKTATKFIGSSQNVTYQANTAVYNGILKGSMTNVVIIVNKATSVQALMTNNNEAKWLYCGSNVTNVFAGYNTDYGAICRIKYIHYSGNLTGMSIISYAQFWNSALDGNFYIPPSVKLLPIYGNTILSNLIDAVYIPKSVATLYGKIDIKSGGHIYISRLAAPTTTQTTFYNESYTLHRPANGTGYNVAPYTSFSNVSDLKYKGDFQEEYLLSDYSRVNTFNVSELEGDIATTAELADVETALADETGNRQSADSNLQSQITVLQSGKEDKVAGKSLVADTEIAKIHSQNTDSTLKSPDGTKSVNLDNAGNLNVQNIVQNGATYETHAEQIYTKKNEMILREGAVSGLGVGEYVGIRAKLYDGVNDGNLVFDSNGWARVGDVGSLQKLATIEESPTNGYLMKYNTSTYRLESIDPLTLPVSTAASRAFVSQNGGTIYHITRWFTPTSALTIAANGLSATITSGQFTSGMTGAKLRLTGGVNEPIITYVSTNQINLSFAVDSSFFGQSVAVADWGVYSREFQVSGLYTIIYSTSGKQTMKIGSNFDIDGNLYSVNDWYSIGQFIALNSTNALIWGSSTSGGTKDLGIRRISDGLMEIYNGVTNGVLRDLKLRSLFADKIIPNSDTTGVVIRNAADGADVVKVDTASGKVSLQNLSGDAEFSINSSSSSIFKFSKSGVEAGRIYGGSTFNIDGFNSGAIYLQRNNNGLVIIGNSAINLVDKFQVNGSFILSSYITCSDWVYLNNGTHTGDAVGDFREKVVSGVLVKEICRVNSATKGDTTAGNWSLVETNQLKSLTDSNELIGVGSFIDLTAGKSGRGSIIFGDGAGYADFIFTSAGVVTLIQYTSNVFTSVQTGTNHVIIKDNGTNVRIVNEMGSTMNFNVKIQYN